LLLTYHHILLDGWSVPLLLGELFGLYERRGDDSGLPEPVPQRSYLSWLASQDSGTAMDAWRRRLSGVTAATLWAPADPARVPLPPDKHAVPIPPALRTAIETVTRRYGLTFGTIVQGAWAILLARLTGRDDVCFGTAVHGRPADLPGADVMIGSSMSVVPVRVTMPAAQPVRGLLAGLQDSQAEMIPYTHLGLARIQQATGLPQLFDTLVTVENYPGMADGAGSPARGLRIRDVRIDDASHFPLRLIAMLAPRPLLQLDYHPGLLGAGEAQLLTGRLVRLLEGIAADPEGPAGALSILTPAERELVISRWNDTRRPAGPATLVESIERRAASCPDAAAVVFEGAELTYREVNERANRLARELAARGAGPQRLVAVSLPRSPELVVTLLAVLKAGAAYLPLDPGYPAERIAFMLADACPVLILTSMAAAGAVPPGPVPALVIDAPATAARIAARPPGNLGDADRTGPLIPASPAYVIFTSGSTGQPKGVVISHASIANRLAWMQAQYRLAGGERVLHKTPTGFDVSVWELFWPLMAGAAVVVTRPGGHREPGYLAALIEAEHVSTVHFVPSMLAAFLRHPAAARCRGLRRVICSGEALPAELATRFHAVLDATLWNLYGPTEAAVDVSYWQSAGRPVSGTVPIGRPVWNTRLYVLDAALNPLPPGAAGELYIAGAQLAQGYLHRAAQTADRFIPDPFGPPGTRLYRTGDLARWRADGVLEFLGRVDDQVKIRGVRVEPGEVEAILRSHPAVTEAAVTAQPDGHGGHRLAAYVVTDGPAVPRADGPAASIADGPAVPRADGPAAPAARAAGGFGGELRGYLRYRLPPAMIPDTFTVLGALPLTASGKLDRGALPAPAPAAARVSRRPRTRSEEILRTLFGEVLGRPEIGIDDDFFAFGGESLLAARLTGRVRAVLGRDLSVRALFEAPTVAALAARLDTEPGPAADPLAVLLPIRTGGDQPPLFCLPGQDGLSWPYHRLTGHLPAGVPLYGLQARGIAQPGRLPGSLGEMVTDYLTQIRAVQPNGPYRLLGWSAGGNIAHAIATRLQSEGAEVPLLAILDSRLPSWYRADGADDERQVLARIADVLGRGGGPCDRQRAIALLRAAYPDARAGEATLAAFIDSAVHTKALIRDSAPGVFRGDVLFFAAAAGPGRPAAGDGWQEYVAGRIETHRIGWGHHDMLTDAALAEICPVLSGKLSSHPGAHQMEVPA
jgi:amino acid adenylation domain-containing protein